MRLETYPKSKPSPTEFHLLLFSKYFYTDGQFGTCNTPFERWWLVLVNFDHLRPLQFNDLYENADLWDSESRTWKQTFEIDKRQLQRFGVHKIIRFLFSRPRAFETYNLSKFHRLSTLAGFSLLFEQHSLFLFQKTRMLLNMKKAAWNFSLHSLRNFETIICYICK